MQEPVPTTNLQGVRPSLVQLTHITYGLHAAAVVIGVTFAATVVAVFLNYLKRGDFNGNRLASHVSRIMIAILACGSATALSAAGWRWQG